MGVVPRPPITWMPVAAANYWHATGVGKIAWVNHIADGAAAAVLAWFDNPAAQASSNFLFAKDGTIYGFIDPEGPDGPYANGGMVQEDATVDGLFAWERSVNPANDNPNDWTISGEHEGRPGDLLTPEQLRSSSWTAAFYHELFGIPVGRARDLGHYEFDAVNRPRCPGWSDAQWAEWEDAVTMWLGGSAPAEPEADAINNALVGHRFPLAVRAGAALVLAGQLIEQAFATSTPQGGNMSLHAGDPGIRGPGDPPFDEPSAVIVGPSEPTFTFVPAAWIPLALSIILILATQIAEALKPFPASATLTIVGSVLAVITGSIPAILALLQQQNAHAFRLERLRQAGQRMLLMHRS